MGGLRRNHWQALAAAIGVTLSAAAPAAVHQVPLLTAASHDFREGFVRVINHSPAAGEVRIRAFDDSGRAASPVALRLSGGTTIHFNSGDLEQGNPAKGLSGSTGSGDGDWRLELESGLDIEVLAYVRTADGFLTAMHDVAASADGVHHVPTFNPASNHRQMSWLRIINPGGAAANVTVRGTDDRGHTPSAAVGVQIPAGAARTLGARELESGIGGQPGIGDGSGKWRLAVESAQPVQVMSLLESPARHLTNLSTAPGKASGGVHWVPLLPSAGAGRQGFVRVINHSSTAGEVRIRAFDESDWDHAAVTLRLAASAAAQFNSDDLEVGNLAKGLSAGVGPGQGDWRLALDSSLDIEVLAYIRMADGFLTSMHDAAPNIGLASGDGARHRVATFNPGSNTGQVSQLRIVNAGDHAASVLISGTDGNGAASSGEVRLTVPAHRSRAITAQELESGADGFAGALGDGAGKWQLNVRSDRPVTVMSLLESPTDHLTNLSTAPSRGAGASAAEWYGAQVAGPVVEAKCGGCHVQSGEAGATRLVFAPAGEAGRRAADLAALRDFMAAVEGGAALILEKIRGDQGHGGGEQVPAESPDYKNVARLLDLLEREAAAPELVPCADAACDRAALVALYRATDGETWTNRDNWLSDRPLDTWHGVQTNAAGRVIKIFLEQNGLKGRLPPELGNLAKLEFLWVADNRQLSGPIPPELGRLGELAYLELWWNNLSGSIPPELGDLAKLRVLTLADNELLSGPLPVELLRLPLVSFIWHDNPGLCLPDTQAFADWIGGMDDHSGSGLCNLADRDSLDALYRSTGGDAWKESGGWPEGPLASRHGISTDAVGQVTGIDLAGNGLAGSLPLEIGDLKHLIELRIGSNPELSGHLPHSLPRLSELRELRYAGTALCVPRETYLRDWLDGVPTHEGTDMDCETTPDRAVLESLYHAMGGDGWRNATNWLTDAPLRDWHGIRVDAQERVTVLDLAFNGLMGTLTADIARLHELAELNLLGNDLGHGPLPPELGRLSKLERLNLSGLFFTGGIPPEFGDLARLKVLEIPNNDLNGSIPPELGNLKQLQRLDLDGNRLSGPLPAKLGEAAALEEIHLAESDLSGPIPAELAQLGALHILDLSGNAFTGRVPATLGDLARLTYLNLSGNDLTGSLPADLSRADGLAHLYLANNRLSGPLPDAFADLSRLTALALNGNAAMAGPLPPGLAGLGELQHLQAQGTGLCAPTDVDLQAWLDGLLTRRVRLCGTEPEAAYLTQAAQSRDLPIALVAGEEALLRVFPTASRPNSAPIPQVRATFYRNGSITHSVDIPSKPGPLPTALDEGSLARSANATVPAAVVRPGLEMVVEVDPEEETDPALGVRQRIPETGRLAVEVREMPIFDVTFVPFLWQSDPDETVVDLVTEMEADPVDHPMLGPTRTLLPIGDLKVTAHTAVRTDSNDVGGLLSETDLIRTMEGGSGHYMGLLSGKFSGAAGVGALGRRVASSVTDSSVIAHEFGHNLSLQHAPCGGPQGIDGAYPYPNGSPGVWGYDFSKRALVSPDDHSDLMSYCGPYWTSDFGFDKSLRYRLHSEGLLRPPAPAAPTASLIVWGGIASGTPFLEPVLVADAPPALPHGKGAWTVTGAAADGAELFALRFDMPVVGDGNGDSSFVFALPVEAGWQGRLSTVTLSGPDGRFTLDGNTDRPMAVLRNPATGEVTRIVRDRAAAERMSTEARSAVFSRGMPEPTAWRQILRPR